MVHCLVRRTTVTLWRGVNATMTYSKSDQLASRLTGKVHSRAFFCHLTIEDQVEVLPYFTTFQIGKRALKRSGGRGPQRACYDSHYLVELDI